MTTLLTSGNDAMPGALLWENYASSMMLSGEAFLHIVEDSRGRPVELWPRRADLVLVQPDVSPERRNFPAVAGYVVMPDGVQTETMYPTPTGMIHDKFYNPLNPWRGLAPISAVRNSIIIDMFAQSWSKAFLRNGARPDYAVIAQQGLTKTERDAIQAEMMYQFGGSGNAGKPIVLESGTTDIKTFSWAPKDIEWIQQREMSRDEVAAVFGVPDEIMGYGRDTYENFGQAEKVFWKLTLRPLITHRDMVLTHFFTVRRPMLKPGQRIETDLTGIGALQDDKSGSVTMAQSLWAMGAPFNQLDEQLGLGIGPVPGGELPFGRAAFDPLAIQVDAAAQPALPDGGSADKGFFTQRRLTVRDLSPVRKAMASLGGKVTRDEWVTIKALALRTVPGDDDAEEEIYRILEERSTAAITRAFREQWRNILPDNAEDMDLYELQAYINQRLISPAVNDALSRAVMEAVDIGVNIAFDQLGNAGIGFDWGLVNVRARDWAARRAGDLIVGANESTAAFVQQNVARWYENGEPLSALTRDLERMFDRNRAQVIAETETTSAAANGSLEGYRGAGLTEMAWATVTDSKVCPICNQLDKLIISTDERFYDQLSPELQRKAGREFSVPPAHVRCRCRLRPAIARVG
ncbi:MAG: phage portal protein [Rhizobiales bacterium]|nr:phage portal protein [Hyphomicrobiales bacterium]